jgi:hypothetical protein
MHPRYRLTGRLETGELAELYEGLRDERDRVVIKLFHPRTSDERYARVQADISARLDAAAPGDAVLRLVEMGMVRGRLALVREHVDGHTLGQALQRLASRDVLLTPPLGLYLVIQLLDTLQKAHDTGAVHGALTPGNVVLGRDGRVALADFGALAALTAVPELRAFAQKGRGTYRAPETAHGDPPTPAADVFSVGAIAYELLTLREPTRGKAVSTRNDVLPPPSRLDRRLNARLDPIVLRALEQQPGRRFKACGDMALALRNFLGASGGMPSRGDLARLLGDLFPGDQAAHPSRELPFSEPFALEPVAGAQVALGAAVPSASVLMARPSFSHGGSPAVAEDGGPPGAQTVEGIPAFALPDRPAPGPDEDDAGTSPGTPVPVEQDWEAPPGAPPVRRRPPPSAHLTSRGASTKGRVRVVEGFDAQEPPRPRKATPPPPPPPPEPEPAPQYSEPGVLSGPSSVPLVTEPDGRKRRMFTEEVHVHRALQRRRRFLAIAGAVALVGAFCFALVVWRLSTAAPAPVARTPPPPPEPEAPPQPVPQRAPPPAQAVRIEPEPEAPAPSESAYLTLTSNLRARVYVNGKPLRGTTPIRRHKLEPGTHRIAVVPLKGGERREFSKRFEAGESVSLTEKFERARRR